jgi:16S rRNA (guanine1516-N2)-methyltransferase
MDDEIAIDFAKGPTGYRFRQGAAQGHALAKAVGATRNRSLSIVDATAGLGRDAFLLASLGCHVTLIERAAEMHARLALGLAKARGDAPELAEVASRMVLLAGDACDLLPLLRADVVLVDPMHPPRGNSALVKKEMRQVRALVGADADAAKLMKVALLSAAKRVVLKWPSRAKPLEGIRKPSFQLLGKTTRYDVFVRNSD